MMFIYATLPRLSLSSSPARSPCQLSCPHFLETLRFLATFAAAGVAAAAFFAAESCSNFPDFWAGLVAFFTSPATTPFTEESRAEEWGTYCGGGRVVE